MKNNNDKYFGSLPTEQIGNELKNRVDQFYTFMNQSGIFRRQFRSISHYFGVSPSSNAQTDMIRSGGKSGQLAMMKVNHYRNLGQHLVQLTTSQKPNPQPVATNSDAKSQQQVSLAKGILDYYNREKRIERFVRDAAQLAIVCGDAFMQTTWNGDDIKIQTIAASQVIRDPNKQEYGQLDWIITRQWTDRFKVADQYTPQQTQQDGTEVMISQVRQTILNQPTKLSYARNRMPMMNWMFMSDMFGRSDDIAVYSFWHKRTAGLKYGRYVLFLQDGTVLWDGPLQYRQIPVRRITPGNIAGTSFGYTPMFDLLVIQEAIDALYSAVATNQMTFGVQLIMAMKGSDIDFKQLSRGLSFIEYANPEAKPEPLNLTHTPAQVFQFISQLQKVMQTISGVNSVVRGNPQQSLKSGSALAMVQAQAISYMSGLQQSAINLQQDVFTDIINILKEYAQDEKTISIVGKYNRSQLIGFKGQDIKSINRIVVDVAGPMQQTVPGRMQIAQDLIQAGLIKKPEQYLAVIKTGNLDPLLQGENAQLILIKSQNQAVTQGKQLVALITDDHSLHIRQHRCVLATPQARQNVELVKAMQQHIASHVQFLSDPSLQPLFAVLGYNTLANAMMPQAGQGYGQQPNSQGQGANLPKNPQTGKQWNPQNGGLDPQNPTGGNGGGGEK